MPSRNTIKIYAPDSFYHLYNRGVDKRRIFVNDKDYQVFLSYFKVALDPDLDTDDKEEAVSALSEARLRREKFEDRLELLAYCLMPSHFHLLVYQRDPFAIRDLMRSVMTGYVSYFNRCHKRTGGLYESRYKGSHIDKEPP